MKLFESENVKIYYFCQAAMAYRQTILLLEFYFIWYSSAGHT